MSRSARGIPKEIAAFGDRQFKETGAQLVEVLRVKASTVRKYFKQLKGVTFLVAVHSLDRVRVYLFARNGILLVGENLGHSDYEKVRKKSRLITKFEKETPPTEEELRIEATEELRRALSKAIRRVSRALAQKEPKFPDIFVSKETLGRGNQSFGMLIEEDGTLIFEEEVTRAVWSEGVMIRAALLSIFGSRVEPTDIVHLAGNCLAISLIDDKKRDQWLEILLKNSSVDESKIIKHSIRHAKTYLESGFTELVEIVYQTKGKIDTQEWKDVMTSLHSNIELSLETGDFHKFSDFCKSLTNPQKLMKNRHPLDQIHLSPRALCDPTPLDIGLSFQETSRPIEEDWLTLSCFEGKSVVNYSLIESPSNPISGIEYRLSINDIFPKSGGLVAGAKTIINWMLDTLGRNTSYEHIFEGCLSFKKTNLTSRETAVLERIILGEKEILENTLIGSPGVLKDLCRSGRVLLVPDFNHIGIGHDYLLMGEYSEIKPLIEKATLESSVFISEGVTYAIVSSTSQWERVLLEECAENGLIILPVIEAKSTRRIIRDETILQ